MQYVTRIKTQFFFLSPHSILFFFFTFWPNSDPGVHIAVCIRIDHDVWTNNMKLYFTQNTLLMAHTYHFISLGWCTKSQDTSYIELNPYLHSFLLSGGQYEASYRSLFFIFCLTLWTSEDHHSYPASRSVICILPVRGWQRLSFCSEIAKQCCYPSWHGVWRIGHSGYQGDFNKQ